MAWRRVGVWACRRVGVWACGRVGVWACGRVGPKGLGSLAQALAWVASYNALGLKDREKPQTLRLPAWEREPSTGISGSR
jgi:hypothetical protein